MPRSRFCCDETGAVFAEFAILLPIVVTIVCGSVDFLYAFYQWNAAAKAVEVGARIAAVSDPVASGLNNLANQAVFNGAMQQDSESIGEIVRSARNKAGLSQKQLADRGLISRRDELDRLLGQTALDQLVGQNASEGSADMLAHFGPDDIDRHIPARTDAIPNCRFKQFPDAACWFCTGGNGFQGAHAGPSEPQHHTSSRHGNQKATARRLITPTRIVCR